MTGPSSPGPLSLVQRAIADGARSRADVVARTHLDASVVDASLDHLVRLNRLVPEALGSGCPSGGCGACPSGRSDNTPGCGPVLLKLSRRP
ncbi:hypothetical protein ACQB6R_10195 [Propionibacteriaceae bacterium G1746]|uniref:hypothetical protein n=1 Tax=Aestuariimicrobium sp. G57 TaxID=3418485 RepID=UPI003C200830